MTRQDAPPPASPGLVFAWAVHMYTAFGAVLGLLALLAVMDGDFREAFIWLAAATAIDSTDGLLARLAGVKARTPRFDGARLDDIVDYLTYVFVPVVLMVRAGLFPDGLALSVSALALLASAFGFSRTDAKTDDHFFTGFPSYWNVVAFYLFAAGLAPGVNAAIIGTLVLLVFVPIGYLYPSRTPALRPVTVVLGLAWAVLICWLIWQAPEVPRTWLLISLAFPAYYIGASLWLQAGRRRK